MIARRPSVRSGAGRPASGKDAGAVALNDEAARHDGWRAAESQFSLAIQTGVSRDSLEFAMFGSAR